MGKNVLLGVKARSRFTSLNQSLVATHKDQGSMRNPQAVIPLLQQFAQCKLCL